MGSSRAAAVGPAGRSGATGPCYPPPGSGTRSRPPLRRTSCLLAPSSSSSSWRSSCLVFGAKKLPEIGRNLGSGAREFKDGHHRRQGRRRRRGHQRAPSGRTRRSAEPGGPTAVWRAAWVVPVGALPRSGTGAVAVRGGRIAAVGPADDRRRALTGRSPSRTSATPHRRARASSTPTATWSGACSTACWRPSAFGAVAGPHAGAAAADGAARPPQAAARTGPCGRCGRARRRSPTRAPPAPGPPRWPSSGVRGRRCTWRPSAREEGDEAARAAAAAVARRLPALDAEAGPRRAGGPVAARPVHGGPGALGGAARAGPHLAGRARGRPTSRSRRPRRRSSPRGTGRSAELFAGAGLRARALGRAPTGRRSCRADGRGRRRCAAGLVAAHCVRLGPGDAALLARRRASAWPTARAPTRYLHCGRAPLAAMLAARAPPSGSAPTARRAAATTTCGPRRAPARDLHAGGRDLGAAELLRLATRGRRGGARPGEDEVGALAPGLRADLVALTRPAGRSGDPAEARAMDAAATVDLVVVGR